MSFQRQTIKMYKNIKNDIMKLEQLLTLSTISKELMRFCVRVLSVLGKELTKYFTIICS